MATHTTSSTDGGNDRSNGMADKTEPLAIVGMACKFPQDGDSNENFWNLLMEGRSAMTPFPENRINMDGHYHPDVEHGGTFHVQGGHFLKGDPAEFDHQFFSITKTELMSLDPQQRLLLENVYQALENAGIPLAKATGSNTSVFTSSFNHDYMQLLNSDPEIKLKYKPMGMSDSILSGRISWFFDFKGPSLTVDTACSSSMVAFHLGAQSLRNHECEMSLICGVNVLMFPTDWFNLDHHGFLAGDGKSYSFDHRASGFSRGEGVATVVLKRLSTALRDGDMIRAVVRATGVNQDGRTPGITLPSAAAQERLVNEVYTNAGLDIGETTYIEAHATGTAAGDPIEARAIAESFKTRDRKSPLVVGAVKSAIGHTESVSGLAGIIKSVMILESAMIPPNTNFEKANPKIPIDEWNLKLPLQPIPWPSHGVRQISINSFGFSGTNGHAVLQDAFHYLKSRGLSANHATSVDIAVDGFTSGNGSIGNGNSHHEAQQELPVPWIFTVSSFDENGIHRIATAYADYLKALTPKDSQDEHDFMDDLAYTLSSKRTVFPWRSYFMASSLDALIESLSNGAQHFKPVRVRGTPKVGFVFTGQGAQWHAMGRELLVYPVFRQSLSDATDYMRSLGSPWFLLEELLRGKTDSKINSPSLAHPACTALQVALVDLLSSWNLLPSRVVGHSSGEIAAAYCAGKISRQDAWKVAYYRGLVSEKVTANGAMLAVGLAEDDLRRYMRRVNADHAGEMIVACFNSPKNHTVSGEEKKIDALKQILDEDRVFARKLNVTTAYHSAHMTEVAEEYLSLIGSLHSTEIPSQSHKVDMFSTVTAQLIDGPLTAQYWVDNLVSPVRFTDALLGMSFQGSKTSRVTTSAGNSFLNEIVEIGPHSALQSAIKDTIALKTDPVAIGYSNVLSRTAPGIEIILRTLGALSSRGSWRHFIRIAENPWLGDHMVTGSVVYPGVGYVIMAIEASRQIADPSLKLMGFQLRDISIKSALIVPDTKEGIETKFTMSAKDDSSLETSKTWRRWRVSSYNPVGDNWIEHCTGYIATEYETPAGPIDCGLEDASEALASKKFLIDSFELCKTPATISYENLSTIGLDFGPLFQNIYDVKVNKGKGEATAWIRVPEVSKVMPKNFTHPHLIHPSTMDSMMHLSVAAILDLIEKSTPAAPMLPTFIKEVWISANIDSTAGSRFRGFGTTRQTGFQRFDSDITIWDGVLDEKRLSVKGFSVTSLGSDVATSQAKKLCHTVQWKPDLDLVKSPRFSDVVLASTAENDAYRASDYSSEAFEGHYRKYFGWCKKQQEDLQKGLIPHLSFAEWKKYEENEDLKRDLYRHVADYSADGRLLVRMGQNITRVLKKEVDPLHLMFGLDNILNQVYSDVAESGNLPELFRAYLEIVYHNNVDLNILEIGAGTGSLTAPLLETLSPRAASKNEENATVDSSVIARYTYTDVSAAFFEKAKDRFKRWTNILDFRTFDIEKEAKDQGLDLGSYDFIVAGHVIHATADLKKTLTNLRSLLKPGGRLIMHEGIRPDFIWLPLAFGQLPGWWLSVEPNRQWFPSVPESDWDVVLRESGFSGIDTSLWDRECSDLHGHSIIISSAATMELSTQVPRRRTLIVTFSSPADDSLASILRWKLVSQLGLADCEVVNYLDLTERKLINDICISVLDLERPVFVDLDEKTYSSVRHLLATSDGVLWVAGDPKRHPEQNLVTGLLRTVRWERDVDSPNLVLLSVSDSQLSNNDRLLEHILTVFQHQFLKGIPSEKQNAEYLVDEDGTILTNRLFDASEVNHFVHSKFSTAEAQLQALGDAGRPVTLATSAPGSLSALHFATDPVWYRPLGEREVEVEIKAAGLNFRDVLIAMGEHAAADMGSEAAGVVTRLGSAVNEFNIGDRVVFMNSLADGGCFKTFGRSSADVVAKLPDSVSYEAAASLTCVYSTAIHGLYDIAKLSKGESILIHAAAGGVGQAAIQLAKLVGAEVFVTVSTPSKRDVLIQEYGIRKDHVFSSRDLSFYKGVMRMTKNRGVDVVLNSLSGDALRRSWDCLAPFGRFIEIGKRDAQANGRIELNPFLRQMVMASVDLVTVMKYKPKKLGQLIAESIRLYAEGKIKLASPTKVVDYTQIEESFRSLQSGRSMGKIVFKPSPEDVVPIVPDQLSPLQFDSAASYVLAGGLGGLGRSIGRWMVSRGARNLIFLSRSGAATDAAKQLVDELEAKGCQAHVFACDVANKAALSSVIDECRRSFAPIKGCIQGSMVLKDAMFENMTFDDFQTALRPKFQGSWNLHEVLPTDMDFFLLLSSATGVLGNRSQANYAAGNTYQDALAQYRTSQGLAGTSIDLGRILSVGYVAENKDNVRIISNLSAVMDSIREDEIHAIIEYHLDPRYPKARSSSYQTVSGLSTAASFRQRGIPVPTYMSYPLFKHLHSELSMATMQGTEEDPLFSVAVQLGAASSMEEAVAIVCQSVRLKLSKQLSIAVDDIDPGKSISSNGVDSLVATEFRTWLARTLQAEIPMLEIMGTSSIAMFSEKVARLSKLVQV
ncbi:hypothetical protein VTN77DRAFT_2662 [Rasamsonia byssochlamydoides]|uniref:uncharacterized protein n=1 Tax=Rasamsonia byssochlamydoides TaxID=89139 RepID=UPI0037433AD4